MLSYHCIYYAGSNNGVVPFSRLNVATESVGPLVFSKTAVGKCNGTEKVFGVAVVATATVAFLGEWILFGF